MNPCFDKSFSSYFPILIKVFPMTVGDVLEVGTGLYSTPLLHWLCSMQGRNLLSVEDRDDYCALAQTFLTGSHQIQKVDSFDEIQADKEWGLAFLDHFPIERREVELRRLADHAQMIVVHDTHPGSYDGIFKYRFDYERDTPNTTVFSNSIDVSILKI